MLDRKEWCKSYYENNKENILKKRREYYIKNRDIKKKQSNQHYINNKKDILEKSKQYYIDHKDIILKKGKQYRINNKEIITERKSQYYYSNREQALERYKQYYQDNKEKRNKYQSEWYKGKNKTDLKFNLNNRMRRAISHSLNDGKNGRHWEDLVGYKLNDLIKRLKGTIPDGYTWKDVLNGRLHIDHIIPRALFNVKEFKQCWSLCNLQLLTKEDNISKGGTINNPILLWLLLKYAN